MKRIITLLVCATLTFTAQAQTDSIAPIPIMPPTYPYLTPLPVTEDFQTDILTYQFDKADAAAKKLIATAKRRRKPTTEYDNVVEICKKGESGFRGVDRVIIVDSVIVDKEDFLKAYPLSADLGTLTISDKGDIVQYQTQLNGMVLIPVSTSDTIALQITRYYLEKGQFTEGEVIEGLGIEGDINYPFLMPDGQTFYFAARSDEGYGNYDLYATRYDSDSKRFYQAENMGYPYNSYANDYMLVIDEATNLGWFASDRFQPNGKVCIYTFIPNESRQTIDYETTDIEIIRTAASLRSITSIVLTDEQKQTKADALRRLKQLSSTTSATTHKDFEFVLNDTKTCYTLNDFTSSEAKQLCQEWLQKTKNLSALNDQLQQTRETSPTARQQILNLETRIMELQDEVYRLEKQIRKTELSK
jgi:hypothetical protein